MVANRNKPYSFKNTSHQCSLKKKERSKRYNANVMTFFTSKKQNKFIEELEEIESLGDGWNGEDSYRIDSKIIKDAKKVIWLAESNFVLNFINTDDIVPHENGTLALHFNKKDTVLSFHIGSETSSVLIKKGKKYKRFDEVMLDYDKVIQSFLCSTLLD